MRRPVDWRHLARPTYRRHRGAPAVAAQRVQRLADVAARDVAAERALTFQGIFNSLIQFSNTIFSEF
jgi:hypothetical protein